ncbi:hypothetical protein D3C87_716460 [compost metagenome]
MMLFTLQMTVVGLMGLAQHGISYFSNGNWIILPFFFIYLCLDIWILTTTFLPIIKISEEGISAYSLFWKRNMPWYEIRSAYLLRTKTIGSRGGTIGRSSVSFEIIPEAEAKNTSTTTGAIVKTFIVVSRNKAINSSALSLGGQLLTHHKLTTAQEIAFEYENVAWQMIQHKVNG